ncbi:MAG TPA: hypothetical protein VHK01_05160 [Lacipirellulaceae bacterium]|jgi:hypothetical protein|nr:hypothetical protein [Lacipirellulaceae bacterium]
MWLALQRTARTVLLLLAAVAGCSQSDLIPVTGTATWKGEPMPSGEAIFFPKDPGVAPSAGRIKDGKFEFLSKAGKMRVEIEAARYTGERDPVEGFLITELYIPARYNKQSELEVEVTPDGENHFEFKLTE